MKSKRIAVLIIMPLIIALTVLAFLLVFNSQYWTETGNDLGGGLTELGSVVVVWLEADIFISLIYFTSKKEKRKDIKTTVNKLTLYPGLYSLAVHLLTVIFDIVIVPTNNYVVMIIYSIFILLAIAAFFEVVIARMIHFVSAAYYIVKDIIKWLKAKKSFARSK